MKYNGEFHGLAQVSRFISPETYRIGLEGDPEGMPAVSFRNKDGTIVFEWSNLFRRLPKSTIRAILPKN